MQNGKRCLNCGKSKAKSSFFKSFSTYHKDGLVPICKKCIVECAYNSETEDIDIDNLKEVLRQVDKPFIDGVFNSAIKQFEKSVQNGKIENKSGIERIETIIGFYFKNLNSLAQYKNMTWDDGISQDDTKPIEREIVILDSPQKTFGNIYTKIQLNFLQALYDFWNESYKVKDSKEREALVNYAKERLYYENALMINDDCLYDDCNNDVIAAFAKLKSLRGGKDEEFANWYSEKNGG